MQLGAGMRPQRRSIGKQHIERAMPRNLGHQFGQCPGQFIHRRQGGVRFGDLLHDPAKGPFAIGITHGVKMAVQARMKIFKIAIVRKYPVMAPKLAYERMAVLQGHASLCGFADVRHHIAAFDRIAPDQVRHR